MKRVLLPILATLLATTFAPLPGMAQSREESRPDFCSDVRGETVCNFRGAEDGNTLIGVFTDSIQRASWESVDFDYITSSTRIRRQAQVNCHESLDHWHRFTDDYHTDLVDVTTHASHRMLNYVCEQAGHPVSDQINR